MLAALDLSLSAGAAWGGEKDPKPKTALYRLPKGDLPRALMILRESVMTMCVGHGIKILLVEDVLMKISEEHGAWPLKFQISLGAVAGEAATRYGAIVDTVMPATWRKNFLGRGDLGSKESKEQSMMMCRRYGWDFLGDHNVAEGCGIWHYGMTKHYPRWNPSRLAV